MALATLTTKGQVTIPKQIRESLKLRTGDKIEIIITEKREALIRPISKKVDDIFGKLHVPGRKAVSVESMNNAIKNRMKAKF
ncbi:MAG: AbrB/MazE/SpoVT family DNA-binding domain-containing protein [Deltaproteobacteria bacterium]|nr:AbrB/MazE/SpoVT family DNA-binding domain-containing protein [Deltaproteobacteria bacterium]